VAEEPPEGVGAKGVVTGGAGRIVAIPMARAVVAVVSAIANSERSSECLVMGL